MSRWQRVLSKFGIVRDITLAPGLTIRLRNGNLEYRADNYLWYAWDRWIPENISFYKILIRHGVSHSEAWDKTFHGSFKEEGRLLEIMLATNPYVHEEEP